MSKTLLSISMACFLGACATTGSNRPIITTSSVSQDMIADALDTAWPLIETQPEKAYALAELVLQAEPKNMDALDIAGRSSLITGDLDAAVRHLSSRHAISADAKTEDLLGLAMWRRGDATSAKPYLMSSLAGDPNSWRSAYALADIALVEGEPRRALDLIDLALGVTAPSSTLLDARGRALLALDEPMKALEAFETSRELSGGRLETGIHARIAMAQIGDLANALDGASQTETARIYLELARIEIAKGNQSKAVGYLRTAERAAPIIDPDISELMDVALAMDDQPT